MTNGHLSEVFKERVLALVADIPRRRVMSYGQIAALCGHPRAARIVGQIAHFGPDELPWQRVVSARGGLASGYYGGKEGHKKDLAAEGIEVDENYQIDISRYVWWPKD